MEHRISHRQRQAQATRALVARAARNLFSDAGYVATTIEAISTAAGVPKQTIYSAFGNKPAILEDIRRLWIAESNVEDLYQEAMKAPEPDQRLRLAARWTRRQMDLGSDVIAIFQEGARANPEVAELWRQALLYRESAVRALLASLKRDRRPAVSPAKALDLYVARTLPEVYRTLVKERGWSSDDYEEWLADTLVWEILGVDISDRRKRPPAKRSTRQRST